MAKPRFSKRAVVLAAATLVLACLCLSFGLALAVRVRQRASQHMIITGQASIDLQAEPGTLVQRCDGATTSMQLAAEPMCVTIGFRALPATLSSLCGDSGALATLRRVQGEASAFVLCLFSRHDSTYVFENKTPLHFDGGTRPRLLCTARFVCVISGNQCCVLELVHGPALTAPEFYRLKSLSQHFEQVAITEKSLYCATESEESLLHFSTRSRGFLHQRLASPVEAMTDSARVIRSCDNSCELVLFDPAEAAKPVTLATFRPDRGTRVAFVDKHQVVAVVKGRLVRFPSQTDLGVRDVEQVWQTENHSNIVVARLKDTGHWIFRCDTPAAEARAHLGACDHDELLSLVDDRGVFTVLGKETVLLCGLLPRYQLQPQGEFLGFVTERRKHRTTVTTSGILQSSTLPPGSCLILDRVSRSVFCTTQLGDPDTRTLLAFADIHGKVALRPKI